VAGGPFHEESYCVEGAPGPSFGFGKMCETGAPAGISSSPAEASPCHRVYRELLPEPSPPGFASPERTRDPVFNRCSLFVVVPRIDHDEGEKLVGWEILVPQVAGVGEGLAAAGCNMAVQSPRGLDVVELGPHAADDDLVGYLERMVS